MTTEYDDLLIEMSSSIEHIQCSWWVIDVSPGIHFNEYNFSLTFKTNILPVFETIQRLVQKQKSFKQ